MRFELLDIDGSPRGQGVRAEADAHATQGMAQAINEITVKIGICGHGVWVSRLADDEIPAAIRADPAYLGQSDFKCLGLTSAPIEVAVEFIEEEDPRIIRGATRGYWPPATVDDDLLPQGQAQTRRAVA